LLRLFRSGSEAKHLVNPDSPVTKVSEACIHMIKHHEGVRNKPYRDPIGLWTVGVGHLIGDGKSLPEEWNRVFTDEEVDDLLKKDLRRFEAGVLRLCPMGLTQPRFDALVSFSFNVGLGNLQRSTLRMKHNREDYEGAAKEFLKWSRAGGKILPGLVRRRNDESILYQS
jgi:lysozyme